MNNDQFQVIVGREDVSQFVEDDVTFSSVDPGGFEASSLTFPRNIRIPRGTDVRITFGQTPVWEGRINEVNRQLSAQPNTQVACHGYGALLKETGRAQIFVDRDFSRWGDMPLNEKIRQAGVPRDFGSFSWSTDPGGGLVCALPANQALVAQTIAEAWYIAPADVLITSAMYVGTDTLLPASWEAPAVQFSDSDSQAGTAQSVAATFDGTLRTAMPSVGHRYVFVEHYSNGNIATPGAGSNRRITAIGLYGDSGIPTRAIDSSNPDGVYGSDVVRYIIKEIRRRTGALISEGVIEEIGYVIPHLIYTDPTPFEQMVADVASLAGFHYGTWEGLKVDFRSRPSAANAWISSGSVDDLQLNDSLEGLFNTVVVTYSSPVSVGTQAVTCTRAVKALDEVGLRRTLFINMGVGTAVSATAFGNIILAISELNAGTTGSFQTKQNVMASGGNKPAFMMKPGIDRMKITDLPASDDGQSEMIVKRMECQIGSDGASTSIELGRGADFIEVIQARLNLAPFLQQSPPPVSGARRQLPFSDGLHGIR